MNNLEHMRLLAVPARPPRLSNVGRNFAYVNSRRPYYVDMVLRAQREDKRLSLVEHKEGAVWIPVEWLDEWKAQHR